MSCKTIAQSLAVGALLVALLLGVAAPAGAAPVTGTPAAATAAASSAGFTQLLASLWATLRSLWTGPAADPGSRVAWTAQDPHIASPAASSVDAVEPGPMALGGALIKAGPATDPDG